MSTIKKNYHTHTYRCQHASGDVEDYCEAAIANGLSVLGMSDHSALPDNRWPGVRMSLDELPGYCAAIDRARGQFPRLKVLKGMESEYDPAYRAFFEDTVFGELQFDYLIGAAHFFPLHGRWQSAYGGIESSTELRAYVDYFVESMDSGLFAFMAHPDLFGNSYLRWDENTDAAARDMCMAAANLDVPLEINGYGLRKPKIDTPDGRRCMYPWLPFWEIAAEYDAPVVVNSDAHRPLDVTGNLDEGAELAGSLGLRFADLSHLEHPAG